VRDRWRVDADPLDVLRASAIEGEEVLRAARELPERATATVVTGAAGHGSVVARADALGQLLDVEIAPRAVAYHDADRLGELVVEAIGAAESAAEQAYQRLQDGITIQGRPVGAFLAGPVDLSWL
jgi:DNA-binding protein YbaB